MESLDMTALSWRGKELILAAQPRWALLPKPAGPGQEESTNLLHTPPAHLGTAHPCLGIHPSGEKLLSTWRPTNSWDCPGGISCFGKIPRPGQTSIGGTDCGCTRSLSPESLGIAGEGGDCFTERSLMGRVTQGGMAKGCGTLRWGQGGIGHGLNSVTWEGFSKLRDSGIPQKTKRR